MGHRPEVPRIGGALASRRYKPYHIKMSPPTGSVSTAATSHSLDNRLSFNDIITWDHKQWQQDPSFNVPQFLASLHEKKLGLFDESQVRIIDSVCSSMESQNTSSVQETSTAYNGSAHQDEDGVVNEDKDARTEDDRIKKLAKGGDLRPLLSQLIRADYSQGTRDPMELIEDLHLITYGKPLRPFSPEQDDFLKMCETIQKVHEKPEEEREVVLDGLVVEICDGLAYLELDRNEKLKDAAMARGEVYRYTEFFQPSCEGDEVAQDFWFDYKKPRR